MRTTSLLALVGAICASLLSVAPAHAQATRTWISGVGDDANPCSRTAPCKTFAGAISKTAAGGEINCLDPGGFGALTITKSIILDCGFTLGSILVAGTNGIVINSDNTNALQVRLRGIGFTGLIGTATPGINGVLIQGSNTSNTSVIIEDCWIDGFSQRGIFDTRTGGGKLYINNSTIQNNANSGIVVVPSSGTTRIDVSINNVRVYNNGNSGIAVTSGSKAMVTNSVISGSSGAGIDSEGVGTQIDVNNSVTSSNGTGVFTGSGGTVALSNTDITFNGTAISGGASSFSNNRISGNGSAGTAPTAIAPAGTNPSGQQ